MSTTPAPAADGGHPLAIFGALFEHERGPVPPAAIPLVGLGDSGVLDRWVHHMVVQLGRFSEAPVERRVAVSTASLGLFARLVSPALGAHALGIGLPPARLTTAWTLPVDHGSWPVGLSGPLQPADPSATLREVALPLTALIAERLGLSTHILRGNLASAVFGATSVVARVRPDLADAASATAASLLAEQLADAGTVHPAHTSSGRGFVRSSCCLYYRIPGGGYCGDCVLAHR